MQEIKYKYKLYVDQKTQSHLMIFLANRPIDSNKPEDIFVAFGKFILIFYENENVKDTKQY